MRLDICLAKKYPQYSRSYIQKLIKDGCVLVNGKTAPAHYQIKPADKITENIVPPEKIDLTPDKSIKFDIIYEDENYLVINKPAGLIVHPAESVKSHTLVNALLAHCPQINKIKESLVTSDQLPVTNFRPGIVHRLDKDVSGLMVAAKTQKAFDDLKKQFKNRKVKKEYTALVYGKIEKDEGIINIPIGRSKKGFRMSARPQPKESDKEAVTRFKVLKRYKNHTLLKIQTLTGRTHQIRVHLHAIGHSIVGDPIYKTKLPHQSPEGEKANLFLHADFLEFHNLDNQIKKFKLELPEKLKNILKNYEKNK